MMLILFFVFAAVTLAYVFFSFAAFYHMNEFVPAGDTTHHKVFIVFSLLSVALWSSALFSLLAMLHY